MVAPSLTQLPENFRYLQCPLRCQPLQKREDDDRGLGHFRQSLGKALTNIMILL